MIWLWDGLNADNNVDLKSLEATLTNQIYQQIFEQIQTNYNSKTSKKKQDMVLYYWEIQVEGVGLNLLVLSKCLQGYT